jgi:hypothetical protein
LANQVCTLTDRQALSESGVMLRNSTGSVVVDMSASNEDAAQAMRGADWNDIPIVPPRNLGDSSDGAQSLALFVCVLFFYFIYY